MLFKAEQILEIQRMSKPIIEWLKKNADPYTGITIEDGSVTTYSKTSSCHITNFEGHTICTLCEVHGHCNHPERDNAKMCPMDSQEIKTMIVGALEANN